MAENGTNDWKLEIVRCPISGERLSPADATLLAVLVQMAAAGKLFNHSGEAVKSPITGGLVNESSCWFYLNSSGVLILSPDEAIEVAQFNLSHSHS